MNFSLRDCELYGVYGLRVSHSSNPISPSQRHLVVLGGRSSHSPHSSGMCRMKRPKKHPLWYHQLTASTIELFSLPPAAKNPDGPQLHSQILVRQRHSHSIILMFTMSRTTTCSATASVCKERAAQSKSPPPLTPHNLEKTTSDPPIFLRWQPRIGEPFSPNIHIPLDLGLKPLVPSCPSFRERTPLSPATKNPCPAGSRVGLRYGPGPLTEVITE